MRKFLLPPIVLLMCIVLMSLLDFHIPVLVILDAPWTWSGLPLLVGGLGIANWHARLFKRVDTNIMTFDEPDKLVQNGMFRYSRNPMYLGFTIAMTGIAVLLGSLSPILVLVIWIAVTQFWYIPFEEDMMLRKFGGPI